VHRCIAQHGSMKLTTAGKPVLKCDNSVLNRLFCPTCNPPHALPKSERSVQVWLAVARLWLVERAEKAAEAGREKHRGSVVHQNCFHPLPVERKDLESLRGKSRVTDSKVWHWQACEVDPCMASHAVYEVGYGRFLAVEEQHGAAFGADMACQVHAFLCDKSKGGLKASELLSPAMTTCITAAIALFEVRPALNLHSPIFCTRVCMPPAVCFSSITPCHNIAAGQQRKNQE
jgi:hypothetical protein